MEKCSNGHETEILSVSTIHETVEEVVYQKERIKHFDREGSEFWTEIEVPDVIEKEIEIKVFQLQCPTCGETGSLRKLSGGH